MKFIKPTFLAVLLLISVPSFSNSNSVKEEPDDMIKKFFSLLKSKGNDAAIDYILAPIKTFHKSLKK